MVNVYTVCIMIELTTCFKSVLLKTLKYTPKMSKNLNFRTYMFVGIFKFDFNCHEFHPNFDSRIILTNNEKFDCLRAIHEIICVAYRKISKIVASYLAISILLGIGQIILYIYIFVVIWKYDDSVVQANMIFFIENFTVAVLNIFCLVISLYLGSILVNEVRLTDLKFKKLVLLTLFFFTF